MGLMIECKHKKRIQLYLDGWTSGEAFKELEEHLKVCPECQAELADLVEVQSAALEMIEQAPDHSYWRSFASRVRNRIIARDIEPEKAVPPSASRFPIFKLASVLMTIVVIMGTSFMFLHREGNKEQLIPSAFTGLIQSNTNSAEIAIPASKDKISETAVTANPIPGARADLSTINPEVLPERVSSPSIDRPVIGSNPTLEPRDLAGQFRSTSQIPRTNSELRNESKLMMPVSLVENPGSTDPAFHLKNAFLGQRIMASLAMDGQKASGIASQGPLYGYNVSSLTGADEPGASSNWGYLRVASDTSQSSEIKKYFIELELMQAK
ncbi:MAG TPA: hypothetical protein DEO84_05875 [candidate division Zixibacteria bacterium]|nr:hypothetical protein [candidate division Zixibacteria bacterium]HBZ00834.1 hypothetical protein [candidate division Zixibacteria bacterium]